MDIIKRLKKENNKQMYQLMRDDYIFIKNIMAKMNVFKINTYDSLIIQRDLIGMAHEMKLRGTTLHHEIGGEVDEFAKEIISNSRGPSYLEIGLDIIKKFSLMVGIYAALFTFFFYGQIPWYEPIGIPYIFLVLIPFAVVSDGVLRPIFVFDKGLKKQLPGIIWSGLFVLVALWSPIEDRRMLIMINGGLVIIVSVITFSLSWWAHRYHMTQLAKKEPQIIRDLLT